MICPHGDISWYQKVFWIAVSGEVQRVVSRNVLKYIQCPTRHPLQEWASQCNNRAGADRFLARKASLMSFLEFIYFVCIYALLRGALLRAVFVRDSIQSGLALSPALPACSHLGPRWGWDSVSRPGPHVQFLLRVDWNCNIVNLSERTRIVF